MKKFYYAINESYIELPDSDYDALVGLIKENNELILQDSEESRIRFEENQQKIKSIINDDDLFDQMILY